MKFRTGQAKLIHIASGLCAIALPSAAMADTRTYVDLTGSVGYSRNPFLDQDGESSVFGRVSASGVHSIRGERGSTNLSAFLENSTYLSDHGSTQVFSLDAGTSYRVSELVQLFGSAEFSGDRGGQLIGRFDNAPTSPPDPEVPLPPGDIFDPDALNLNRRQYRVGGMLGTAITVSERDNLTISATGRHVFFGENGEDLDYTVGSATVAWQRQLSERTRAGAQMSVQRANYPGSDNHSTIYSPQLTLHTALGVGWDADFAAGASFVRRKTETGSDRSISPAFDASVCRTTESASYCGRASYSTEAATRTALKTARVGVDYFNRLNAKDTIQANLNLIHHSGDDVGTVDSKTTYYSAGLSFGRKFTDRLSAGATTSARKVVEKDAGGIPLDLSVSAFVRYRLGDIL